MHRGKEPASEHFDRPSGVLYTRYVCNSERCNATKIQQQQQFMLVLSLLLILCVRACKCECVRASVCAWRPIFNFLYCYGKIYTHIFRPCVHARARLFLYVRTEQYVTKQRRTQTTNIASKQAIHHRKLPRIFDYFAH